MPLVPIRGDVVFTNLYAGNRTPEAALRDLLARPQGRRRRPLLALLCEANNAWPAILRAADEFGYDAFRPGSATKGQREVVAMVRSRRAEVVDVIKLRVAPGLDSRIAPDRWAIAVLCELRRGNGRYRFAGIATHWHASLQGKDGGVTNAGGSAQRVAQAADQTRLVLELAEQCRDRGFPPIVAADCNVRATSNAPTFAPPQAFPPAGLSWDSVLVDGIGADRRAFHATPVRDFPVAGTDHRGGRAGLRTTLTFKEHR